MMGRGYQLGAVREAHRLPGFAGSLVVGGCTGSADTHEHTLQQCTQVRRIGRYLDPIPVRECGIDLGAIQTNDPIRIHRHALSKWTQFCFHLEYVPSNSGPHPAVDPTRRGWGVIHRIARLDETYWLRILDGLEASHEGRVWLTNNRAVFGIVLEAMKDQSDSKPRDTNQPPAQSPLEERIARYPVPPKAGSE
jgi:hypothetical protein